MIRIINQGGLGNQLFIWNLAHHYRSLYPDRVVIYFGPGHMRSNLNQDTIAPLVNFCSHNIEIKTLNTRLVHLVLKIIDKLSIRFPKIVMRIKSILKIVDVENSTNFLENCGKKPVLVRGFFQNSAEVWKRKEVLFREINSWLIELNSLLRSRGINFVDKTYQSCHVRRGDYRKIENKYGLLSLNYYTKNILSDLKCLIASDDRNIQEEFSQEIIKYQFISNENFTAWETFSILSGSKYLIMGNSTYSWWAGFMVSMSGGSAIAPKPWFKGLILDENYLSLPGLLYSVAEFEN